MYVCMFRRMHVYIITQNSDGTQIQRCMYLITYTRSITLTTYMFIRTHEWAEMSRQTYIEMSVHMYRPTDVLRTCMHTYKCIHTPYSDLNPRLLNPEP